MEDVPRSCRLVKLTVEFGDHKRKELIGIKEEREDSREVEGKQALFVVKLEVKEMMGEVTEGMIFNIGYTDKITPVMAVPETPMPNERGPDEEA